MILNLLIPQVEDDVEEINELVLDVVGSATESARQKFEEKKELN